LSYSAFLVSIRPEELTISGLPKTSFGGVKADAVAELLKRVAWDYRGLLAENKKLSQQVDELKLVQQALALQVEVLEKAAVERREPDELGKALLGSAQRAAREQREAARREGELLLKKARRRAQEIEDDAQQVAAAGLADLAKLDELRHHAVSELREALQTIVAFWQEESALAPEHFPAEMQPLNR
jgi:cell division septum initiation protein DivIVA